MKYFIVYRMHDKIHQMKNIAVRLPKELEGPELVSILTFYIHSPLFNKKKFNKFCVDFYTLLLFNQIIFFKHFCLMNSK